MKHNRKSGLMKSGGHGKDIRPLLLHPISTKQKLRYLKRRHKIPFLLQNLLLTHPEHRAEHPGPLTHGSHKVSSSKKTSTAHFSPTQLLCFENLYFSSRGKPFKIHADLDSNSVTLCQRKSKGDLPRGWKTQCQQPDGASLGLEWHLLVLLPSSAGG